MLCMLIIPIHHQKDNIANRKQLHTTADIVHKKLISFCLKDEKSYMIVIQVEPNSA